MGEHSQSGWRISNRSMAWTAIIIAIVSLMIGAGQLTVGVLSLGGFNGPGTISSASPRGPAASWGTSTTPASTARP